MKRPAFLSGIILATILGACNPMHEDLQGDICSSLHPSKPIMSTICHGSLYRFPIGGCDESNCHGSDLRGGNSGAPSCYTCHGDIWTIFSTTHTLKVAGWYHHTAVDTGSTTDNTTWFGTCKDPNCHGATLAGVPGAGYACSFCHGGTPPPPAPGHRVKKEGGAWHHFNYERENEPVYCSGTACHGADGRHGAKNCESAGCHD